MEVEDIKVYAGKEYEEKYQLIYNNLISKSNKHVKEIYIRCQHDRRVKNDIDWILIRVCDEIFNLKKMKHTLDTLPINYKPN